LEDEEKKKETEKVFQSKYETESGAPTPKETAGVCPMGGNAKEGGVCPVDHSAMAKAFVHMTEEQKKEGFIYKLYEKEEGQETQ